jgi:hypothetical protein
VFWPPASEVSVHGHLVHACEQNIMAAGACGRGAPSPHEGQEAETLKGGAGDHYKLQSPAPSPNS